jgi:serine/threonine protein kinase
MASSVANDDDEQKGAGEPYVTPDAERYTVPAGMDRLLDEIRSTAGDASTGDGELLWTDVREIGIGDRVGPYRVQGPLGVGGMGVVVRAADERSGDYVALKLPRVGGERSVRRFRREFDLLRSLDDPGIVPVLDFGVGEVRCADGASKGETAYFAMELVAEALTLKRWADEHGCSVPERVRLVAEVARIVQAAHGRGVHHLDLKPSNVLVDENGRPRVIDFGVARASELGVLETTMTGPGQQLGTLAYMAPEQASGGRGSASAASDVYSLGAVLYELLVGRPPHVLEGLDYHNVLRTIHNVPPTRPRAENPAVLRGLDAVVMKCLASTPGGRYPTADALRSDLLAVLEGETVSAIASERRSRVARWIRRHTVLWTTCVSAAVFLLTVLGSWLWVQWWMLQPVDVAYRRESGTGVLLSRSGLVLHTYEGLGGDRESQPSTHIVLLTPERSTAGRQVLVRQASAEAGIEARHRLRLFDLDAPDSAIWESDRSMPVASIPDYIEDQPTPGAEPRAFLVADVFDECPGVEIIVAEQNVRNAPTRIRVYGRPQAGALPTEVVYETWNVGFVNRLLWDADRRLIIAAAFNNRPDRSALPDTDPHARSIVTLFALRPQTGTIREGFLTRDADATQDVVWHAALPPLPGAYVAAPDGLHWINPDVVNLAVIVSRSGGNESAWRGWRLDPSTGAVDRAGSLPDDAWRSQMDCWGVAVDERWGPIATCVPFFEPKRAEADAGSEQR